MLAGILRDLKEYTKAIYYYNLIRTEYPEYKENNLVYKRIGICHYHLNKYDEAIQNFKISIASIPEDTKKFEEELINNNSWIARCELKNNNYENVISICSKLIDNYPNNLSILNPLWIMADAYKEIGEIEKALEIVEKAISIFKSTESVPNSIKVYYNNVVGIKNEILHNN